MSVKSLVLFVAVLLPLGVSAGDPDFTGVEQASARADSAGLTARIDTLERRLSAAPGRDLHYLSAYARYRLAAIYLQQDLPARARPVLKKATAQLRSLLQAHPDFADGLVLLAAVYGLEMLRRPFKAVYLGPRANKLIDRALALEPSNPRAYLMKGVAKFQTPGLLGGSVVEARRLLRQGLSNIQAQQSGPGAIRWGLVDLHLWLGRVAAQEDRREREQHHYTSALALSPGNYWVLQAMAGRGYRYSPSDSP